MVIGSLEVNAFISLVYLTLQGFTSSILCRLTSDLNEKHVGESCTFLVFFHLFSSSHLFNFHYSYILVMQQ